MTYADFLILLAALQPFFVITYAKAMSRKTFNNATPRDESAYQGVALRAYNAHLNGFESFPFFAIAVLFAEFRGAEQFCISMLAAVYVVARLFYNAFYLQDKPTQRSTAFSIGLLVSIAIFLLPLVK